jgi:hypothetical protein
MRYPVIYISIFLIFLPLYSTFSTSCLAGGETPAVSSEFPKYIWFQMTNPLTEDDYLAKGKELLTSAKSHGINGVVLAGGLDSISRWDEKRINRLREFKQHCDQLGIEVIPGIFSVGYGSPLIFNPNLAAATPFNDIPYVARGNKATFQNGTNIIKNPGFEISDTKGQPNDFKLLEKINEIVFYDTREKHSGRASIRLENFNLNQWGHARLVQPVTLRKNSLYEISAWIKTENFDPPYTVNFKTLHNQTYQPLEMHERPKLPEKTQDWTRHRMTFFSGENTSAWLYFGTWEAKSGKIWIDDIELKEINIATDVPLRPGTPIVVKSADRNITFEKGADYEIPPLTALYKGRTELVINIPSGSRISDGEKLIVSGYSVSKVDHEDGYQISVCMSEPELYEIWDSQVKILYSILKMKKAFLTMDEIRGGGGCKACQDRHMSMAQILGDCVHKEVAILRKYDPKMEIFIWSDMFDPNANAHDNYYKVVGSFDGSWKYVPKDVVMACWLYDRRKKSLSFFESEGFHTMGCPYYDKKSLDDTVGWFDDLANTKGSVGIMYTTWKYDFSFLNQFADYAVKNKRAPK